MFDYYIIGQHSAALREGRAIGDYYVENDDGHVLLYAGQIKEALEAGMADIVAHPDLFMYSRAQWSDACEQAAQMICDAALAADVPLEVNMGGISAACAPSADRPAWSTHIGASGKWQARKGNKVIYGLDAHDPQEYLKKEQYDIVDEVIAGLDLHFIASMR